MEKRCAEDREWLFPAPGDRLAVPLTSIDKRENFMLDVTRAQNQADKSHIPESGEAGLGTAAFGYRWPSASKPRR